MGGMEDAIDTSSNAFEWWQCCEHFFAVACRSQTAVEDGDAAHVAFGAYQAPDGLDEFDAGFGHGDFHEGIATLVGNPIAQRFVYGVVGHGEGQLGDDDVHAGKARQVQAFGKAVQSKNNAHLVGLDFGQMLLQQSCFGHVALHQ